MTDDPQAAPPSSPPGQWPVPPPRPADHATPATATPPGGRGKSLAILAIAAGAVIVVVVAVVVVAVTGRYLLGGRKAPPAAISQPSTTFEPVAPFAEAALEGLLLDPTKSPPRWAPPR